MLACHLQLKMKRNTECPFTSVYRKPTFSEAYKHFDSFLPSTFKFGTVYNTHL